jgi:hypothetical protein
MSTCYHHRFPYMLLQGKQDKLKLKWQSAFTPCIEKLITFRKGKWQKEGKEWETWFRFTSMETHKSKNSASTAEVMWLRIKTINSVSLRRFVSAPDRNAWGISRVQNSKTFARLHERSNMTQHFLCWNSKT